MKIEIDQKRLDELERAEAKLDALEAGGVDNWEWYDEALKSFREEETKSELFNQVVNDILECICSNATVDFVDIHSPIINIGCEVESRVKKIIREFINTYTTEIGDE